jgi:Helix-turn-helix domain
MINSILQQNPPGAPSRDPDFIQIPYHVLRDTRISHAAKLVYGRLKLYQGRNGQCNPKHETLAREVCLSSRQLRTVLSELRKAGWIDWHRTRSSCSYTVFSDRRKTSYLDRKETADLDRRKTAYRRSSSEEITEKKKAAAGASSVVDESPKRATKAKKQTPLSENFDDDAPAEGKTDSGRWWDLLRSIDVMPTDLRWITDQMDLAGVTPEFMLEIVEKQRPLEEWNSGPGAALKHRCASNATWRRASWSRVYPTVRYPCNGFQAERR